MDFAVTACLKLQSLLRTYTYVGIFSGNLVHLPTPNIIQDSTHVHADGTITGDFDRFGFLSLDILLPEELAKHRATQHRVPSGRAIWTTTAVRSEASLAVSDAAINGYWVNTLLISISPHSSPAFPSQPLSLWLPVFWILGAWSLGCGGGGFKGKRRKYTRSHSERQPANPGEPGSVQISLGADWTDQIGADWLAARCPLALAALADGDNQGSQSCRRRFAWVSQSRSSMCCPPADRRDPYSWKTAGHYVD